MRLTDQTMLPLEGPVATRCFSLCRVAQKEKMIGSDNEEVGEGRLVYQPWMYFTLFL
jgi:hypothetical protein